LSLLKQNPALSSFQFGIGLSQKPFQGRSAISAVKAPFFPIDETYIKVRKQQQDRNVTGSAEIQGLVVGGPWHQPY
jgi:hypothetical protein